MDGDDSGPVCRRVTVRVGDLVVGNALSTKRALPSVHTLTGSLRVDIVAIRQTCRSLAQSKFVRAMSKGNDFITSPGGRFVRRRRLQVTRRLLRGITVVNHARNVDCRRVTGVLGLFFRR